jgi:hypothetical protein
MPAAPSKAPLVLLLLLLLGLLPVVLLQLPLLARTEVWLQLVERHLFY